VYLATVDIRGVVLVWEVESKQSLARWRHPTATCITSLAWSPLEEALAYAGNADNVVEGSVRSY